MAYPSPVQQVDVLYKVTLTSNGEAFDETNWIELEIPEAAAFGPRLAGVLAIMQLEGKSTYFGCKVGFVRSFDGKTGWGTDGQGTNAAVIHTITNDGIEQSSEYTTVANFGRRLKFMVQPYSTTPGAVERGVVSLTLVFRFKS